MSIQKIVGNMAQMKALGFIITNTDEGYVVQYNDRFFLVFKEEREWARTEEPATDTDGFDNCHCLWCFESRKETFASLIRHNCNTLSNNTVEV